MNLPKEFSWSHMLRDGGIMSLLLGAMVMVSLRFNSEIWHDDYPPDIQERAGPMSETAKRQRWAVVLPFFGTTFGILIGSTLRLKQQNAGRLSFAAAFLNVYGIFQFFNVFDLVVLDYGLFVTGVPSWVILPGTEDMMESYKDFSFHVKGFVKGTLGGILPCLVIAWLLSRNRRGQSQA